jgi:hypothetical protein
VLQVRATSCTRTRATAANISNAKAAGPASRAVPPTSSLIRSSRQGPSIKCFHTGVLEKPAWSQLWQAQTVFLFTFFTRTRHCAHYLLFCNDDDQDPRVLSWLLCLCSYGSNGTYINFFVMRHLLTLIRMARGVYNSRNFEQL